MAMEHRWTATRWIEHPWDDDRESWLLYAVGGLLIAVSGVLLLLILHVILTAFVHALGNLIALVLAAVIQSVASVLTILFGRHEVQDMSVILYRSLAVLPTLLRQR